MFRWKKKTVSPLIQNTNQLKNISKYKAYCIVSIIITKRLKKEIFNLLKTLVGYIFMRDVFFSLVSNFKTVFRQNRQRYLFKGGQFRTNPIDYFFYPVYWNWCLLFSKWKKKLFRCPPDLVIISIEREAIKNIEFNNFLANFVREMACEINVIWYISNIFEWIRTIIQFNHIFKVKCIYLIYFFSTHNSE